jgi:hypothetical protein
VGFDLWIMLITCGKMVAWDFFDKTHIKSTWMCSINTPIENIFLLCMHQKYKNEKHLNMLYVDLFKFFIKPCMALKRFLGFNLLHSF